MEDKMASGALGRATNYGLDGPFVFSQVHIVRAKYARVALASVELFPRVHAVGYSDWLFNELP